MSEPTVCAVMLTRDRPEFARRAVECFRTQTYENKRLLIWDTGMESPEYSCDYVEHVHSIDRDSSIGKLRNHANLWAVKIWKDDVFVHLDDDDWSHPQRIAEQVALLQASGAECVGYRECLFWRDKSRRDRDGACEVCGCTWEKEEWHACPPGFEQRQAWLYTVRNKSWVIGSSMCYWRRVWEKHPFPDLPRPGVEHGSTEDVVWRREVKCMGVQSIPYDGTWGRYAIPLHATELGIEPRMICRIHGGNSQDYARAIEKAPSTWRRTPEWDEHCRKVLG